MLLVATAGSILSLYLTVVKLSAASRLDLASDVDHVASRCVLSGVCLLVQEAGGLRVFGKLRLKRELRRLQPSVRWFATFSVQNSSASCFSLSLSLQSLKRPVSCSPSITSFWVMNIDVAMSLQSFTIACHGAHGV